MFMNFLFNKIKCSKFNILKIGAFINILIWGYIIILCKVKPPIIILPIAFFYNWMYKYGAFASFLMMLNIKMKKSILDYLLV